MTVRGWLIAVVVGGTLASVPLFGLAQMGPGQGMAPGTPGAMGPGSGPRMQMHGMMQQMQGMMGMMGGGAPGGGTHGMMGGMGSGAGGPMMMQQMSQMMQQMADMQKRLSEIMGAPAEKK